MRLLREVYDIYESSYRVTRRQLRREKAEDGLLAYMILEKSKAINGMTKPIYEYLPHFLRPNQLPVLSMRLLL